MMLRKRGESEESCPKIDGLVDLMERISGSLADRSVFTGIENLQLPSLPYESIPSCIKSGILS